MSRDNATVILDTTDPDRDAEDDGGPGPGAAAGAGPDISDPYAMSELIPPTYRTPEATAARQAQLEREDIAAGNAYRTARLDGADRPFASRAAGIARRAARAAGAGGRI